MTRILICGGRDFTGKHEVVEIFGRYKAKRHHPLELICGMAPGADTIAYEVATQLGFPVHEFPADWKRYGRSAGPLRNKQMLTEGRPDRVHALLGGRGTMDMIKQALDAGVPVDLSYDMSHQIPLDLYDRVQLMQEVG